MTARAPPGVTVVDRRDNEMSHQDEPIPHAVNNDRAWRRSQGYDSVANCGRLAIRHAQRFA